MIGVDGQVKILNCIIYDMIGVSTVDSGPICFAVNRLT